MKNMLNRTSGCDLQSRRKCARAVFNNTSTNSSDLIACKVSRRAQNEGSLWICHSEQGELEAGQAISLLVAPHSGDTVLVARTANGAWILNILERSVHSPHADIQVPGAKSVRLSAPELLVEAPRLRVRSAEAEATVGRLTVAAEWIAVAANRLQVWSRLLHQQADSWVQQARQRITRVEGTDLSSARNLLLQGDEVARVDAGVVQVLAKNEVMIDGKRVVVG